VRRNLSTCLRQLKSRALSTRAERSLKIWKIAMKLAGRSLLPCLLFLTSLSPCFDFLIDIWRLEMPATRCKHSASATSNRHVQRGCEALGISRWGERETFPTAPVLLYSCPCQSIKRFWLGASDAIPRRVTPRAARRWPISRSRRTKRSRTARANARSAPSGTASWCGASSRRSRSST
jgi:hypothetical protein